jgi:hypothetical protein
VISRATPSFWRGLETTRRNWQTRRGARLSPLPGRSTPELTLVQETRGPCQPLVGASKSRSTCSWPSYRRRHDLGLDWHSQRVRQPIWLNCAMVERVTQAGVTPPATDSKQQTPRKIFDHVAGSRKLCDNIARTLSRMVPARGDQA